MRFLMLFVMLPATLGVAQDKPKVTRPMVERFKKLTPEQKRRLGERLEAFRKLTPEERHRLKENLERFRKLPPEKQEKLRGIFEKMTPEEKVRASELASGFAKWSKARLGVDSFPRLLFFRWAGTHHAGRLEELKSLDERKRKDEFLRLAHEFREVVLKQVEEHAALHHCVGAADLAKLREESFGQFWSLAELLNRQCPKRKGPHPPKRPNHR